jgi:hypothetical protein
MPYLEPPLDPHSRFVFIALVAAGALGLLSLALMLLGLV